MKNDFYLQIVNEAPFGFAHHEIIVDEKGKPFDYRFIDVNKAFEKLTGLKKENLTGRTVREVFPGIDKDNFDWIGSYGKIALHGGTLEIGQYSEPLGRWYRVQAFSTEKMFFTTLFYDITTEKLAEQDQQREKQANQNYLDTTETIMVSLDNSGNVTMLNRYGLEILGYKPDQIIGKNWFETVLPQPEGMNVVFPVFQSIISGDLESVKSFENDVITGSGERRTIAWRNSYQLDDSGNVTGTLSSGLDITGRKRMEETLRAEKEFLSAAISSMRESEARFTTIFQASPAAMAFTRLSDNQLVEVNAAWEVTTGYTREETIGHTIAELNIWVNPEQRSQIISEISAKGKVRQEVQVRHKSGDILVLLMSAEKIQWAGETYLLSSSQDITERRKAEKALLKSERHAHALISAIPDMIFRMNSEGVFLDYKAAKEDLYLSPELFLGKNISDIMPGWFAELALDKISKTISSGDIIIFEYSLPIQETRDTHFECRMVPYSGNEVLAIVRNISERKEFEGRIKESEERFRRIFEDSPVGIALVRNDFRFIRANDVFCNMIGISSEDLKTHTFKDITHRDNISGDMEGVRKLLSGESQVYKTEKKYIRKDESIVWANANISIIRNQTGEFLYFLAIIEDITQRKQAEILIKSSEEKYRTLFESLSQGIFYQAANGKIIDTNDAALRMFGLTRDQFLGIDSFDTRWKVINENNEILPPEKHPSMVAILAGKPVISQTIGVLIPEMGKYTWLIIDVIPQFHPGETKPYQVFASMQDITRRKMAEEAQKEAEQRFRTMFESHQAVMLLIEPYSGAIVDANLSASEFYGYSIETLRGMSIDQINCDAPEQVKAERLNALNEKRNYFIFLHKLSNGETRTVEVHSTPITIGKQKILFSIIHDITQRKKTEIQLQQSEHNLRELNATKDKFFSIIAHDLKSPFNSIIGFSDLLKEDARNLDVKDIEYYASIINSAANQTLQLLDNLLHWARMQQGRMEFEPRNLLLREITSEVIDLLTEAAQQKTILLNNNIPEMTIINADENMIKTTIRNLVSNALKFTRSGGSVEISAKFSENETHISVTDTGIGISQENIGKLFNIGSSYTTRGTGNEKGTGLGLILCKEFIEKHGGKIGVESLEGKGSVFFFTIPCK